MGERSRRVSLIMVVKDIHEARKFAVARRLTGQLVGDYTIVGGKEEFKQGNNSLKTAKREFFEEGGLDIKTTYLIPINPNSDYKIRNVTGLYNVNFFAYLLSENEQLQNKESGLGEWEFVNLSDISSLIQDGLHPVFATINWTRWADDVSRYIVEMSQERINLLSWLLQQKQTTDRSAFELFVLPSNIKRVLRVGGVRRLLAHELKVRDMQLPPAHTLYSWRDIYQLQAKLGDYGLNQLGIIPWTPYRDY